MTSSVVTASTSLLANAVTQSENRGFSVSLMLPRKWLVT
jgi:hypothetical protein